jgi:hypothetical protein
LKSNFEFIMTQGLDTGTCRKKAGMKRGQGEYNQGLKLHCSGTSGTKNPRQTTLGNAGIKRSTDKPLLGFDRDEISRASSGQGYCDQGQKIRGINDARD